MDSELVDLCILLYECFLIIVLDPNVEKLDDFLTRLELVCGLLTKIKVGNEDFDLIVF